MANTPLGAGSDAQRQQLSPLESAQKNAEQTASAAFANEFHESSLASFVRGADNALAGGNSLFKDAPVDNHAAIKETAAQVPSEQEAVAFAAQLGNFDFYKQTGVATDTAPTPTQDPTPVEQTQAGKA